MEEYLGILTYELKNIESKSEGHVALLDVDGEETQRYNLYRGGVYAINDDYFAEYDQKRVIICGEVKMEKWIEVKDIKIIDEPEI